MFTLYRMVKRTVAETDPLQCEHKQELRCVAGITSFENGANSPTPEQKLFRKQHS